jgi:hypothetical protein
MVPHIFKPKPPLLCDCADFNAVCNCVNVGTAMQSAAFATLKVAAKANVATEKEIFLNINCSSYFLLFWVMNLTEMVKPL